MSPYRQSRAVAFLRAAALELEKAEPKDTVRIPALVGGSKRTDGDKARFRIGHALVAIGSVDYGVDVLDSDIGRAVRFLADMLGD